MEPLEYPSVCLVTTCYNHEDFVGDTIESVLSQGYPNLEYVVINDGSTDNSEEVIRRYSKHLHYWETWPGYRSNNVPALNRGFSSTSAQIMGWLSSDDLLVPNSLFVIGEVFSQLPEVQWLTGVALTADALGRYVKVNKYRKNIYDFLVGDWRVIQQESTFWRRSLWEAAGSGLSEDYSPAFDAELWCRFFLCAEHYHLDSLVGAYRKVPQSRSIKKTEQYHQLTESALNVLRESISREVSRWLPQNRIYRRVLRMIGSPQLAPLVGKVLGRPEFQYKSISYGTMTGRWSIYSEW